MTLYEVTEQPDKLHLPQAWGPEMSGGAALTLCGWCDVQYEEIEAEPAKINCGECLRIVVYCKSLKGIPKP